MKWRERDRETKSQSEGNTERQKDRNKYTLGKSEICRLRDGETDRRRVRERKREIETKRKLDMFL